MTLRFNVTMLAILLASAGSVATAQEIAYPEKCKASDKMAMQHEQAMDMPGMDITDFQKDFLDGMKKTTPLMSEGMMKVSAVLTPPSGSACDC